MLAINEVFLSYQGEGIQTGTKMYFIRTQGCGVGCHFCDTKQTWRESEQTIKEEDIVNLLDRKKADWVCITGGEPLEQDISKLVNLLKVNRFYVCIETSGMYYQPILHMIDRIVVSPKALFSKMPLNDLCLTEANELKCVVTKESDIDYYIQLANRFPSCNRILQCVDNSPELAKMILERSDLKEWKLMAQQQKILHLR